MGALHHASSDHPHLGLNALIWVRRGAPHSPAVASCLVVCVSQGCDGGSQCVANSCHVPAFPSLQRLLESWRGESVWDAAPRACLCSFLLFGSCLFPGSLGCLDAAFICISRCSGPRRCGQTNPTVAAGPGDGGWTPPHPPSHNGDALCATITSSGKFPGPKWGKKRLVQGKTTFWLFARGSCLLSPVFSSATELFCNAGNFTCLLCASVFLITRRKIIQASFPRDPRGFVNEHDKVLWDPWLKAQP